MFGALEYSQVHILEPTKAAGYLELSRARVRWFLSIDANDLPPEAVAQQKTTYRSITIGEQTLEFSSGFADLHNLSYRNILNGSGFGLDEVRASIATVSAIRNASVVGLTGEIHPYLK